MQEWAKEEQKN